MIDLEARIGKGWTKYLDNKFYQKISGKSDEINDRYLIRAIEHCRKYGEDVRDRLYHIYNGVLQLKEADEWKAQQRIAKLKTEEY